MQIKVLLFGQLKDIIGKDTESLELQTGSRLSDLMAHYAGQFPKFKPMAGSIACSVNQEYATSSRQLHDGDEVGLLPPVSGGRGGIGSSGHQITGTSGHRVIGASEDQELLSAPTEKSEATSDKIGDPTPLQSAHCAIVRERIDSQRIADSLKAPEDGAALIFEGIVRDHTRGRRTLYLDYESYESMAINEMEKLSKEALEMFKVRDVRLIHRLGRLQIGETSVLIVVASAHRGQAFEACRWLIDTLKKTVPIWKKEYFEDGAVWADGEPFPEEIRIKTNPELPPASN